MYRESRQISTGKPFLPSPTSDDLSDSTSSLTNDLDEKRRQIDGEIEAFKDQKEREFRLFKNELRLRNTQTAAHRVTHSSTSNRKALRRDESNGRGRKPKTDSIIGLGLKSNLGPSKPSISLDRVTINGMTTPPVSGTPPLAGGLSRSPVNLSITLPGKPEKASNRLSAHLETLNDFHGVLTPDYFQLIDTKPSSLPRDSIVPSPLNPPRPTIPIRSLSSNSLASALRTSGGTDRKRKHVTFRLAHSVVVDPNSSYEEIPSPMKGPSEGDLEQPEGEEDISSNRSQSLFDPTYPESQSGSPPGQHAAESNFFSFDEDLGADHAEPSTDDEEQQAYDDHEEPDEIAITQSSQSINIPTSPFSCGSLPIAIVRSNSPFRVALSS